MVSGLWFYGSQYRVKDGVRTLILDSQYRMVSGLWFLILNTEVKDGVRTLILDSQYRMVSGLWFLILNTEWYLAGADAFYMYEPPAIVNFQFTAASVAQPTDPTVVIDWGDGAPAETYNSFLFGAPGYT